MGSTEAAIVFAFEEAVAPVARVTASVVLANPVVADVEEGGFARVDILEGRALAFSLSFGAMTRAVRVTRRVCKLEQSDSENDLHKNLIARQYSKTLC